MNRRHLIDLLRNRISGRLMLALALGLAALVWACSSVSRLSYSEPQNSVNQWMIEFRTGEDKIQLSLHYRSENRNRDSSWSYSNVSRPIPLSQLVGLTREQA